LIGLLVGLLVGLIGWVFDLRVVFSIFALALALGERLYD
jgi:hypothetical protein